MADKKHPGTGIKEGEKKKSNYVLVKREWHDQATWTTEKCLLCGKIIKETNNAIGSEIWTHFKEKHPEEYKKRGDDLEKFNEEVERFKTELEKKYPNKDYFPFETILGYKKMWKCPDCEKLMNVSQKKYHQNNAYLHCEPKHEIWLKNGRRRGLT